MSLVFSLIMKASCGMSVGGKHQLRHELIEERWYLEKAFSQKHVIVGTLDSLGLSFQMVNENGEKIDEYQVPKLKGPNFLFRLC